MMRAARQNDKGKMGIGFKDEDITAACAHTEKLLDLRVD
jgi:hypothetical protein